MDLKSAHKQVLGDPAQVGLTTIAVWSPVRMMLELFIALCQLFGGTSPPLNVARYPAWMREIAAVLFGLPTSHCVVDMISVEPEALASSGSIAFRSLCMLTGWAISEDAPTPSHPTLLQLSAYSWTYQPYRRGKQQCGLRPGGSSSLTSYWGGSGTPDVWAQVTSPH